VTYYGYKFSVVGLWNIYYDFHKHSVCTYDCTTRYCQLTDYT